MIPLLYIGIAFAIFAIIFFLSRRPFRLEDKIASAFLFFLGFPMLIKLEIIGTLNFSIPGILLIVKSYPFTYGPLLYLYTKFEIDPRPVFKKIYMMHFVPFIIFAIMPFIFPEYEPVHPAKTIERRPFIESRLDKFGPPPYTKERQRPDMPPEGMDIGIPFPELPELNMLIYFTLMLIVASFVTYSVLILLLLQKHKKNISEYFSYDSIRLNLRWLRWITICFVISYSFVFITVQINPKILYFNFFDPRISPDIAISFFILAFSFFAVKQPVIFSDTNNTDMNNSPENDNLKKYEKSGLKEDKAKNYLDVLEKFMIMEKPYLDPDITISDLSDKLDIPRHYLTQIINERLKKNFFMYINEFRVMEAKQMMDDYNYRDYTILRIAYESGFNSKSGFNTIFKRLTGYTPSEYKKKQLQLSNPPR
jgi:AraC-like DNA-binding protein